MSGIGAETGARIARARALGVLRVRSRAVAGALLPAAAAVILLAGGTSGHLVGSGWDAARWAVSAIALLVVLAAGAVALVIARARPALTPTVAIHESAAPDLYRLVRDLADRLDVPAPSAIALTPDCDSWLEDRTHRAHGPQPARAPDEIAGPADSAHRRTATAPVLVIGSPFLWWMRVGELRAVLAPVVAGTGPSAHPDIAAARRFVRGLDAALAVAVERGRRPGARPFCAALARVVRLLLRACQVHAAEMERGVASAAAERAQAVDYGLRIVAQEQVGLAYAGWDRLLTRVALPAWRMGRWPARLDAGVVAALTELSRRDRLAEGFASRLGERPACDLLEEPGAIDEATSLLAARLFHGGPAEPGPDWSPVDWQEYPEEVVDRKWRTDAARLHRVLDALGVRRPASGRPGDTTAPAPSADGPTLSRVLDHLTATPAPATPAASASWDDPPPTRTARATDPAPDPGPHTDSRFAPDPDPAPDAGPDLDPSFDPAPSSDLTHGPDRAPDPGSDTHPGPAPYPYLDADADADADADLPAHPTSSALATRLGAEVAREEAAGVPTPGATGGRPAGQGADAALWDDRALPLFPLQPPRTDRELLTDHVTAMVCCAAMDTVGATPGLDWLDGPTLLIHGERVADLTPRVLSLVEEGDAVPLRAWLVELGIRPEKPVRLG